MSTQEDHLVSALKATSAVFYRFQAAMEQISQYPSLTACSLEHPTFRGPQNIIALVLRMEHTSTITAYLAFNLGHYSGKQVIDRERAAETNDGFCELQEFDEIATFSLSELSGALEKATAELFGNLEEFDQLDAACDRRYKQRALERKRASATEMP